MIHLTIQQLSASLDGALTGPSLDLVVRHLAMCPECRDRQARLVRTDDALRRLLAQQTTDAFLDDLSVRAESWIAAIAQGLPEPGPRSNATHVPAAPTASAYTPPPPMPAPAPSPSPSVVHPAGWGVIGMKPSASPHPPASDPDETRRLLEALERAEHASTTPAAPTDPMLPPTANPSDLPTWLQEQARRAAESQLPQGPGLAQASAPPTAPFPREASAPAWPLPQPQVEAPRPWFVPTPAPAPVMAVPQEHAAYAPPVMQPSPAPQVPAPAASIPSAAATPASPWASAPTIPQPPAPDPIAPQTLPTRPGTGTDRYLSFEQHRQLTRGTSPLFRIGLTIGIMLVASLALVVLSLLLTPAPVRVKLGERVRELVQRRAASVVTTLTPVHTDATTTSSPATTTVDELVPSATTTTAATAAATSTPTESVTPTPNTTTPGTPVVAKTATTQVTSSAANAKTTVTATDDSHWLQSCGVVVDGKGAPIAGARITVTEIALTLRADAQGRFCIAAPAGPQHLLIEAPGFTQVRQAVRFAQGSPDLRLQLDRIR